MQENLEILKVLDEEILILIDEDGIDEEIEQCDICRVNLQLALENIEGALHIPSIPSSATVSNGTPPAQTQAPHPLNSLMQALQANLVHQTSMKPQIWISLLRRI